MTNVAFMAYQLAEYVRALPRFEWWEAGCSDHAGEVLANAVLQSGVNYRTVVAPRLARIRTRYSAAATVRVFRQVLHQDGAHAVLEWKHDEKPRRLMVLTDFIHGEGVDAVSDLSAWLRAASNRDRLLEIHGVGPKTVDYLCILVGVPTVAVDRHLRSFAKRAGIECFAYDDLKHTVEYAADMLGVKRSVLDYSIWRHESDPQYDLFAQVCVGKR